MIPNIHFDRYELLDYKDNPYLVDNLKKHKVKLGIHICNPKITGVDEHIAVIFCCTGEIVAYDSVPKLYTEEFYDKRKHYGCDYCLEHAHPKSFETLQKDWPEQADYEYYLVNST